MVVDSSAIIAIALDESDADEFETRILTTANRAMSVVSLVEASVVMRMRRGASGLARMDTYLAELGIRFEPVTLQQAILARTAYETYGKGVHPAKLNLGDCFSYALAKTLGEPLLFKGDDFSQTDITPA